MIDCCTYMYLLNIPSYTTAGPNQNIKGLTPPAADPRGTPLVELDVFLWLTAYLGWGPTGQLPFCLNDARLWTFKRGQAFWIKNAPIAARSAARVDVWQAKMIRV